MSDSGIDLDFILSLAGTIFGGLLSAYLAKKMLDALDTGKKVIDRFLRIINRMQRLQNSRTQNGNESLKNVRENHWKLATMYQSHLVFMISMKPL